MKSIFPFLLLLLIIKPTNAQVWIDSGAVWHYNYSELMDSKGYAVFKYSKDTIIQNHICQKITSDYYWFYWNSSPDIWTSSPVYKAPSHYTYVNGDTVFYLASDNEFRVLLNFGAQIGDTWDFSYDLDSDSTTQDTSRVVVVDAGVDAGDRFVVLEMETCSHNYFAGKFHEQYGFTGEWPYDGNSFFPEKEYSCLDGVNSHKGRLFPCSFSDASFQLNGNSPEECKFPDIKILGDIENKGQLFNIYPNPAKGQISIAGDELGIVDITIVGLLGRKVFEVENYDLNKPIDVSNFKSGTYIVRITTKSVIYTEKIVIF